MKSKRANGLWLTLLILSGFSCSTAKFVNTGDDQRLRTMSPPPEMALVYFVRPALGGAIIRMPVTCDGMPVGSTNGKRYIYTFVKPGKREFVSKAENKDELALVTEAGETYFIEQKVKAGLFIARNQIELINNETEGRKKLAKCKLSGDCPAYLGQERYKVLNTKGLRAWEKINAPLLVQKLAYSSQNFLLHCSVYFFPST